MNDARKQKVEAVKSILESLKDAGAVYLVNYSGITVDQDNLLRKSLTTKGVVYRAAKNTILKLAFAEAGITGLDDQLKLASAIMVGSVDDPMLPAKEIVAFHKENPDFLAVKGINLDGEFLPGSEVEAVSKMPGRLELISEVVTLALGPGSSLAAVLLGTGSTIAGQLKALEEKLED